ncbi:MAG: helix-turn-helix domain-containing protein [Ruminiclostridium sp.]|nr:helix-turn-helix domain-containing protein [Ruminiclostridium sp.]
MVNIFKCSTKELKALVEYKNVLEKDTRFPKDFWTTEKYQYKGARVICRILTRYCLENIEKLELNQLPQYNLKQIKQMLVKNKLFGMIQRVFSHDILMLLKNAYPDEFRNRLLKEWMWSKHGIWHDDNAIIEAVQDMVRKEGILRINNIPHFDWKKRLLKHGIYNVLSYFNWSIYSLFNFVYPKKFHPADFKYKMKWAAAESLENAFHFMHKTFKSKRYNMNEILMLSTSDFRRIGLAGMLMAIFHSSTLKAKEYYLYKSIGNEEHQKEIKDDIYKLIEEKQALAVRRRLSAAAAGKYIYNLHDNSTLYGYIKRHAKASGMTINDFISNHGFVYKSAKKDARELDRNEIWNLRKQGFTYVQIAQKLGSNPTTITELCNRHFGGDPLIPRPLEEYITVQELMDRYHVDHKTIMKLIHDNNFENHTTIRFRYLKKSEIEPALEDYINKSKQHISMVNRYSKAYPSTLGELS